METDSPLDRPEPQLPLDCGPPPLTEGESRRRLAETLKYSNEVALILALDDGWFAVFNNQRQLQFLTTSTEQIILGIQGIGETCQQAPPRAKPLSLEDLGL